MISCFADCEHALDVLQVRYFVFSDFKKNGHLYK